MSNKLKPYEYIHDSNQIVCIQHEKMLCSECEYEYVKGLEQENKRYKEAWIKAKREAKEYGAGRADENISDDDKEEAYREGAEDMYGDFVDEYERALNND